MPKLTENACKAAKYRAKPAVIDGITTWPRVVHWDGGDGGVKGLGLRLFPSGEKTWVLSYRVAGRKRLSKLAEHASFPAMSLHAARETAKEELGRVNKGADPLQERADKRAAAAGVDTVAQLGDSFLESGEGPGRNRRNVVRRSRRLAASSVRNYRMAFVNHINPRMGARRLDQVSGQDVLRLHSQIARDAPYMANRVVAAFSAAWAWGQMKGVVPRALPNPAAGCADVEVEKEGRKRGTALTPDELQQLGVALHGKTGPLADALRVYLLSGGRPDEVLGMKWTDLHADGRRVKLSQTKTGSRMLYLGALPAGIVAAQPRRSEFVFASTHQRNKGGRLAGFNSLWPIVRDAAKLDPSTRLYDAGRHTFTSRAYELGYAEHVVRKLTGHTESDLTAHSRYRHLSPATLLAASDAVALSLAADLGLVAANDKPSDVASA